MNNYSYYTTTFCRKCKKIRNCLETNKVSNYRFLCKECGKEEQLVSECISCGRECIANGLIKNGGYCHLCIDDNIIECELCGAETYKATGQMCKKCVSGENKECTRCGGYFSKDSLTSDNLCTKCSIKLHRTLRTSGVNEVVECIECGREVLVNDLNDKGLCIYCKCEGLESEIKKLKRKKKKSYY